MINCFAFDPIGPQSSLAFLVALGVFIVALTVIRKNFFGRLYFIIGFVAIEGWLALVLLELLASDPMCKMTWAETAYFFIALLPTTWAFFLYDYSRSRNAPIGLMRLLALLVAPAIIMAMAVTNEFHHHFYLAESHEFKVGETTLVEYHHGPLFYVASAYLYAFMTAGFVIALMGWAKCHEAYRGFFTALVLITLLPSAGNIAYVAFGVTFLGFDPTPFLFAAVMIILALMIVSNRVFDVTTVAKHYVFHNSERPKLVVDTQCNISVSNSAFHELARAAGRQGITNLREWPELREAIQGRHEPGSHFKIADRYFQIAAIRIDKPIANDDAPLGNAVILHDVTPLKEANTAFERALERAEEVNRLKSQFLANMSHEIRTPLNGVLGMAEVLSHELTSREHRKMVEVIRSSGDVLLNILNDILDLSKIEAGKMEIQPEPFSPAEIVRRACTLHQIAAEAKNVSLHVRIPQEAGPMRIGDPMRIMQVLNNLLSNATKFTEEGSINVSLSNISGKAMQIEVSDTGIGMSREQTERMFEDFEQADGAITRRYGGTGLGMAIVRRLIDMMAGRIDVSSRKGIGTRITLLLPLEECEQTHIRDDTFRASAERACRNKTVHSPAAPALKPSNSSIKGLRILAADDNATNRLVLGSLLKRAGAETVLVANGREAVERFPEQRWDVVLLDINMPEMDGVQALQAINTMSGKTGRPRPPVIAISANVLEKQITQYKAAGFDGHVGKPFKGADVQNCISDTLAAYYQRRLTVLPHP